MELELSKLKYCCLNASSLYFFPIAIELVSLKVFIKLLEISPKICTFASLSIVNAFFVSFIENPFSS